MRGSLILLRPSGIYMLINIQVEVQYLGLVAEVTGEIKGLECVWEVVRQRCLRSSREQIVSMSPQLHTQ